MRFGFELPLIRDIRRYDEGFERNIDVLSLRTPVSDIHATDVRGTQVDGECRTACLLRCLIQLPVVFEQIPVRSAFRIRLQQDVYVAEFEFVDDDRAKQ